MFGSPPPPHVISTMIIFLHILLLHFHQHALAHFSLAFNIETLPEFYIACPLIPAEGKECLPLHDQNLPCLLTKHSGDIGNLDFQLKQHYLFIHTLT